MALEGPVEGAGALREEPGEVACAETDAPGECVGGEVRVGVLADPPAQFADAVTA